MTDPPSDTTLHTFDDGLDDEPVYDLTLFVSGASDLAARAISNARRLCESHISGRFLLTVVDVQDNPATLLASRVIATPTLVKNLPTPARRVVGDLSQTDKVLRALDMFVVPSGESRGLPAASGDGI